MTRTAIATLATTLLVPAVAFAHPGHGTSDATSWVHYVVEPAHALWLVPVAAGLFFLWTRRNRGRSRG